MYWSRPWVYPVGFNKLGNVETVQNFIWKRCEIMKYSKLLLGIIYISILFDIIVFDVYIFYLFIGMPSDFPRT